MSVGPSPRRGVRVLVVAKAPLPGRVKTRLAPAIGADRAAALARALLLDALDGCRREIADVGVLHARDDDTSLLARIVGTRTPLVAQPGRDLGDALEGGMRTALAGREAAILVGSDIPGVPAGSLLRAVDSLSAGADVVLGPSEDGGYWLIAMRRPHAAPFERIPWSTDRVLADTVARCAAARLAVAFVDRWRDVDTLDDLRALDAEAIPGARTKLFIAEQMLARASSNADQCLPRR